MSAGPDRTITLPGTAQLTGTASDDGLPNPPAAMTRSWTKVSGPGTVTFSAPTALSTTASFSASGAYVLRLTVSDGALTASDDVSVTVNPASGAGTGPHRAVLQRSGERGDEVHHARAHAHRCNRELRLGFRLAGPGRRPDQ